MRILLLGEYSNVHHTLAVGLRTLGHEVCVASDGDVWKDYERDIDLKRKSLGLRDTIAYLFRVLRNLPRFRNYDVVQIINPVFLDVKPKWIYPVYKFLRRHNKKLIMGAFGMDYYWVKTASDCTTFEYSDFNFGKQLRYSKDNDEFNADWLLGEKGKLNRYIANDCDAIVSGLYEYDASYRPYFDSKLTFIPFPIEVDDRIQAPKCEEHCVRFFIGIQKERSEYKGTDIMWNALQRLKDEYPKQCIINRAESVPYSTYIKMFQGSDVILDQLYSYTPAMNALQAMAQGLIVVGGGEPENYAILNETTLHPIINVKPNEEDVYQKLKHIVEHPEVMPQLKADSIEYIRKHHDHIKVAKQYIKVWERC